MTRRRILASQSPRRKELLELAELTFETHAADIDETLDACKPLRDELKRLALEKARAVEQSHPGCIVLGADTTVVKDDEILGKTKNKADAKAMLKSFWKKLLLPHPCPPPFSRIWADRIWNGF